MLRAVTRWTLHCQKLLQNRSNRHFVTLNATTTIEDDVRYRSKATHGPSPTHWGVGHKDSTRHPTAAPLAEMVNPGRPLGRVRRNRLGIAKAFIVAAR
jgi:hypothetical protein